MHYLFIKIILINLNHTFMPLSFVMDFLSIYGSIQQNRHILEIPYFSLSEFWNTLNLKTSSHRLLMSTIFGQLFRKMGSKNSLEHSLQQTLNYYNNQETRIQGLQVMRKFVEFVQLPVCARLEMLNQLLIQVFSSRFPKYDAEGKYLDSEYEKEDTDDVDDIQSFQQLGFDLRGNSYAFIYPDIVMIQGVEEPKMVNSDKLVVELVKSFDKLSFDELGEYFNTLIENGTERLETYLKDAGIMQEQYTGKQEPLELFPGNLSARFLNFKENKSYDGQHLFFDDNLMAVKNLLQQVESGEEVDLQAAFQYKETEESNVKQETESDKIGDLFEREGAVQLKAEAIVKRQSDFLKYQQLVLEQLIDFKEQDDDAELCKLTTSLLRSEMDYITYSTPYGIKYLKQKKITDRNKILTTFVKITSEKQLFGIINYVQAQAFMYLKQKIQLKGSSFRQQEETISLLLDSCYAVSFGLSEHYLAHSSTQRQQLEIFSLKNIDSLLPLSQKRNICKIKVVFENRQEMEIQILRNLNIEFGNKNRLKDFPIWLWNRDCVSRSTQLEDLRILLGYEKEYSDESVSDPLPEPEPEKKDLTERYLEYQKEREEQRRQNQIQHESQVLRQQFQDQLRDRQQQLSQQYWQRQQQLQEPLTQQSQILQSLFSDVSINIPNIPLPSVPMVPGSYQQAAMTGMHQIGQQIPQQQQQQYPRQQIVASQPISRNQSNIQQFQQCNGQVQGQQYIYQQQPQQQQGQYYQNQTGQYQMQIMQNNQQRVPMYGNAYQGNQQLTQQQRQQLIEQQRLMAQQQLNQLRKSRRQQQEDRLNKYDGGGELADFVVDDQTDSGDNMDYIKSESSEGDHKHRHHKEKKRHEDKRRSGSKGTYGQKNDAMEVQEQAFKQQYRSAFESRYGFVLEHKETFSSLQDAAVKEFRRLFRKHQAMGGLTDQEIRDTVSSFIPGQGLKGQNPVVIVSTVLVQRKATQASMNYRMNNGI